MMLSGGQRLPQQGPIPRIPSTANEDRLVYTMAPGPKRREIAKASFEERQIFPLSTGTVVM